MKLLKKVSELLSPNDPELVEKTLARLGEQDMWNDVFSTKLIELLDKIDEVKSEIRERLRRSDERIQKAESVVQAESLLLEKAKKFGDASKRLEIAEAAERQACSMAEDARNQLGVAATTLEDARSKAEVARGQSEYASKQLRLAQEAHSRVRRFSRIVVRYATMAVALSWIAMSWIGWFLIHTRPALFGVVTFSILITVAAAFILRGTQIDA